MTAHARHMSNNFLKGFTREEAFAAVLWPYSEAREDGDERLILL